MKLKVLLLASNKAKVANIIVATCNNTSGKRKWDKPLFCVFCSEKRSKIARHLLQVHKKENEVMEIVAIAVTKNDGAALKTRKVERKETII